MIREGAAALLRCAVLVSPILAAACTGGSQSSHAQGYVEGEFVRVAPETSGRLVRLDVMRGQPIKAGDPLFALDDRDEKAALAQAEAQKAQADAQLADLKTGRRPEEIRVLDAQLAEAEAALVAAQKAYDRNLTLSDKAVASAAALDQAKADLDAASARVEAAKQNRAVAELPARPDAIRAAEQSAAALAAAVEDAKTRLERRQRASPVDGRIDDSFFRVGETVPAGQAVVSLLPADGRKIVFFVAEAKRAQLKPGAAVGISCDGCADGLTATISRIAAQAEFAPPIIYSTESRAKLVFRVEARPEGAANALEPGQPIDVTLSGS